MATQSRTSKVLALSLGNTLTVLVGLVSGMVAARVLAKHDYATMRQTMLAYQFAEPLLSLALPGALYYFLPGSGEKKRGLLIDNLTILFFMGGVYSLFLLGGGNKLLAWRFSNPDLEKTLFWMIPYPLFTLPAALLGAVLVVQGRVNTLTIYNVFSRLLLTTSIIAACIFTKSYSGPILAQVVFAIIALPVVLWLTFTSVPGGLRWPETESMKAMIKYSVPLGLATMLGTITLQLDKLIVSSMCTPEQFAVYSNGAIEIPLIGVITGSIATIILADMAISCKCGRFDEALELFRKAAILSGMLLLPAMVFLLVFADDFIVILYSDRYLESVTPFRIYLLALPIRIVFYGSALMALGMTKVILWRSIGDLLVNACLSVVLVYYMGYLGAAIATLLTLYLWTAPFNIKMIAKGFKCQKYGVLPFAKIIQTLLVSLVAVLCASPLLLWKSPSPFLRLPLAGLIFSTVYFFLAHRYCPDFLEINTYIITKIRRIIPFAARPDS